MSSFLLYTFVLLFFSLDIIMRGILHYHYLQSMLAIFCIMLFRSRFIYELLLVFLLLMLEDFLDTNVICMSLLYIIPLALAGISLQKLMHPNSIIPIYGFFALALFCKFALLAYFNNFKVYGIYTLYEIFANLIMLTLCLKLLFKGRLGNRL